MHHLLRWYLLAWDVAREDWRVFRLDRMTRLRRTARRFTPRELPAESALAYVRSAIHRRGRRVGIVAAASSEQIADAWRYDDIDVQPLEDGRSRIELTVADWPWLVLRLAMLDADVRIEDDELSAAVRGFAERLLSATTT